MLCALRNYRLGVTENYHSTRSDQLSQSFFPCNARNAPADWGRNWNKFNFKSYHGTEISISASKCSYFVLHFSWLFIFSSLQSSTKPQLQLSCGGRDLWKLKRFGAVESFPGTHYCWSLQFRFIFLLYALLKPGTTIIVKFVTTVDWMKRFSDFQMGKCMCMKSSTKLANCPW